ncbi:MAG: glycosyltransferase [Candidatus Nealsonbacteria bacterium]|nr:glycosyltransferase [Candidatus Nealsonbacteria bacterium]
MKKILFIVTQSELGGAQRYILKVLPHLKKEGFSLLAAAGKSKDNSFFEILKKEQQFSSLSVETVRLKRLQRAPGLWNILLGIKEITSLLEEEKPDILFLCSTTAGILGSLASYFYRKKNKSFVSSSRFCVIYRIGGWSFKDPRPSWMNKILIKAERFTALFKDKIIVNSRLDRDLAIEKRICPPDKISVIYNGLDPENMEFLPKEKARAYLSQRHPKLTLGENDLVLGCVANFYKTKGLPYLINSVPFLEPDNVKLLLIGDGKERKDLETIIKKNKLENNVFLLGKIPQAQKYLKAFDIFVLPSLKEGFPWVVLEAMAAETPVIATKVGALPEVMGDGEGFLVPPGNSKLLAEGIRGVIEDPQKGQGMARQAKQKIEERFSLQKMVAETKRIISSC